MPQVSIIIPVYNAEKTIERCVDSILEQEFRDFELILVDDGSTDSSPGLLDAYAAADERVRVLHKQNAGVSSARNDGIARAQGTYVQFVDADDWITADATKLFVRAIEDHDCDMVIADFYRVIGDRVAPKGDIDVDGPITRAEYADFMQQNPADYYYGVTWNKFFKRSLIEQHDLRMNPNIDWAEDFIFNMEYILHCETIYPLHAPVYYYVRTEGSLVASNNTIGDTVRMKLNVVEYYRQFYENVYGEGEEPDFRTRMSINTFYFTAATDGEIPRLSPKATSLGDEMQHAHVAAEIDQNPATALRYASILLNLHLSRTAEQYRLDVRDLLILIYIDSAHEVTSLRELMEFTDSSRRAVRQSLSKLSRKGYLVVEMEDEDAEEAMAEFGAGGTGAGSTYAAYAASAAAVGSAYIGAAARARAERTGADTSDDAGAADVAGSAGAAGAEGATDKEEAGTETGMEVRITLTEEAEPVLVSARAAMQDFDETCFEGVAEEDREVLSRAIATMTGNVQDRLAKI